MNFISRGIRNAFRNGVRTISVVIILGLSVGLALAMVIARGGVQKKINSVESSIGNTVSIAPAGYSGFSQVNNALTTTQLSKVQSLAHVTSLDETLTDRLTKIGSTTPSFGQSSSNKGTTSLTSPVTLNTSGSGAPGGGSYHVFVSGGGSLPTNFSLPVTITGTNDPSSLDGNTITLTSGKFISGTATSDDVLVSSAMASKNNLKVGSTFTAYSTTMTVSGIFKGSTQGDNNTIIVSLPTEQSLSGQSGDVTSAVASVDSLGNLSSVTTAIKNTLGSSADVTSAQTQAQETTAPLKSIQTVSLYSLIGAVAAGSVIILLTMIMIVRERRREIGVLKAIGASNMKIMLQFIAEAITFTSIGAVVGLALGVVGGNPITKVLVSNSTTSTSTTTTTGRVGGGFGGGFTRGAGGVARNFGVGRQDLSSIHAVIGWDILVYGLVAALVIAIIGSAIPALLIAKVRPAEVLRTE